MQKLLKTDKFEIINVNGYDLLYSPERLNRDDSKELGLYHYASRHSDDGRIDICQIKEFVWANHSADLLSKEKLPLNTYSNPFIADDWTLNENDVSYTQKEISVQDYIGG